MNRNLIAAGLAALALPSAALDAAAAPGAVTQFGKTYFLGCQVSAMDGTALKVRMMVKNTSGRIIKEGARIEISVYAKNSRFGIGQAHTAYRTVYVNDSIGFDQMKDAYRCIAKVTLRPDVETKVKVTR